MSGVIALIGAGQMGSGISQLFATAGYDVSVYDISQDNLDKSKIRIEHSLAKLSEKNLIKEPPAAILSRINFVTKMSELADSQVFIESAF